VSSHLLKVNDGVSRINEYPTEKGVDKKNVTQYEILFWHLLQIKFFPWYLHFSFITCTFRFWS